MLCTHEPNLDITSMIAELHLCISNYIGSAWGNWDVGLSRERESLYEGTLSSGSFSREVSLQRAQMSLTLLSERPAD